MKDKDNKDSPEYKEVNVYHNEQITIKENSDIKGVGEILEKNLDGVEETHDQFLDDQVDINNIFDNTCNIKDNKVV